MRALIVYSKQGGTSDRALQLAAVLQNGNCQVQLMGADPQGSGPISCAPYDIVVVGSPTLGFFGGKIGDDLPGMTARFVRLEGKKAAAFVLPKLFGTVKALKAVMALLEKQGAMVEDFATLRDDSEVQAFGQRLLRLVR